MKKILLYSFLFLSVGAFAQQPTYSTNYIGKAKITFQVTYPEAQPSGAAASALPAEQVIYLKYDLLRIETKTIGGSTNVMIVDSKNRIATELVEKAGKKYAVKTTWADVLSEAGTIPYLQVKEEDDYKDIVGYSCQKDDYTITDKKNEKFDTDIYVNKRVVTTAANWYMPEFKEVTGFMFEYAVKQNGVVIRYTVNAVDPLPESNDKLFEIPSGYKQITKQQAKAKMVE